MPPRRKPWRATHHVTYWRSPGADPVTIAVQVDDNIGHAADGDRIVRLVGVDWHWARAGHPGVSRLVVRAVTGPKPRGVSSGRDVKVRLTDEERDAFDRAAGDGGTSTWLRDLGRVETGMDRKR